MNMKIDVDWLLERQRFHSEKFRRLTKNTHFISAVKEFRKKWSIPDDGLVTDEQIQRWHRVVLEKGKEEDVYKRTIDIAKDISAFSKKVRLSQMFSDFSGTIEIYLLYDKVFIPMNNLQITPNKDSISLTIYPSTRKQDLYLAWPLISHYQKHLKAHQGANRRLSPTFEMDSERIIGYRNEGLTFDEIAEKLTNTDLPSNNRDSIDESTVRKRVAKFNKTRNSNQPI